MYKDYTSIKSVNRAVIFINWLMVSIISGGLIAEYFKGGRELYEVLLIIIISVLTILYATLLYKRNPENSYIRSITFFGLFIIYAWVYLSSEFLITFIFIFPFVTVYSLYSDNKYIYKISILTLLLNIIKIIYEVSTEQVDLQSTTNYTIQIGTIIMFFASIIVVVTISNTLKMNIQKNIDELKSTQKAQKKILDDVLKTASILDKNANEIHSIVEKISTSSIGVGQAVDEIAKGSIATSEDIQKQSQFANEIQNKITDTLKISEEMDESAKKTVEVVKLGLDFANRLGEKTKIVNSEYNNVYNIISNLKSKTANIENIIEVITNIAEETNLLALNASIESARVGEVGRGFGVVANEIKSLADQTKNSAADISNIIKELLDETSNSVTAVSNLRILNNEQTNMIGETEKVLQMINDKTIEVRDRISLVKDEIEDILIANGNINEAISNLSAVSEQTMANAQQASSMTHEHINDATRGIKLAEELLETSKNLHQYI